MLIIYAVRIVIYPHCLSIVASRQTKLWNESAPDHDNCYAMPAAQETATEPHSQKMPHNN